MNWELYHQLKEERYERFLHTLDEMGLFLLKSSDDEILYKIFEEFAIDFGNLHRSNLEILFDAGYIDKIIMNKCQKLYHLYYAIEFETPELFNLKAVRSSEKWYEIMSLSDEIKKLLYW